MYATMLVQKHHYTTISILECFKRGYSGVFCESILVFESIIVFVRECNGVFKSV